ncbi:MAG: hypothetical protein K2P76_14315 [Lachnospiraceae bacterium]|nr:hypothetical protein [Lachnospiraceae bacterium]MDE6981495.1 hypothetical protein [Lachnospiraceae bacterium]
MNEVTCKNINKTLHVEESGEILSVEVLFNKISSQTGKDIIPRMLNVI